MTTITEQVRAAAEEIANHWTRLTWQRDIELKQELEAIITKHVHPASLAEPKKLVDEIDDLLSEAIGYDYTNRGPAMIALERLVERNSAPVGPSLTDAIEAVKRLRDEWEREQKRNRSIWLAAVEDKHQSRKSAAARDNSRVLSIKVHGATEILATLQSLEGKAPVGESDELIALKRLHSSLRKLRSLQSAALDRLRLFRLE